MWFFAPKSLPLLHGFKTSVAQPLFFIKKWLEYNYSRVTTPVSIVVEDFLIFYSEIRRLRSEMMIPSASEYSQMPGFIGICAMVSWISTSPRFLLTLFLGFVPRAFIPIGISAITAESLIYPFTTIPAQSFSIARRANWSPTKAQDREAPPSITRP